MAHDPFADYFERDYLAAGDFVRQYGVARDIDLRLSQFGMRKTRVIGGQRGDPTTTLKPVVFFVEHPGKPMFLNRTNFEALLDRFGPGFWLEENRSRILYAPQRLSAEEDKGGKDGVQYIVRFHRGPYTDHTAPIGETMAGKVTAALEPLGFTREKFRHWIKQEHHDLLRILDAFEDLAEYPFLMLKVFDHWRKEVQADTSRAKSPPAADTKPPPWAGRGLPPRRAAEDGGIDRSSGFTDDNDHTITGDDIPF